MPKAQVTTLLLDADGVIQRSSPDFITSLQSLCPDPTNVQAFIAEVFRVEKPCLDGGRRFEDALQGVFARWQVEVPLPTALQLWKQIEPNAQVMRHVATLRSAGVRVCVASNQQSHRAGIMADHLGYRSQFDALFFSCELGFVKPDVRYFEAMLNTLEVAPESVLFVDDHQQNVDAAKTTGMGAALYELNQGIGPFRAMLETHQRPT